MTDGLNLAEQIHRLTFADPQLRLDASRAIHRAGVSLCAAVIEEWLVETAALRQEKLRRFV